MVKVKCTISSVSQRHPGAGRHCQWPMCVCPVGQFTSLDSEAAADRMGAHLPRKAAMTVFLHAGIFPLFKPHNACTWFSWHLEWQVLSVIRSVNADFPGRSVCPFFAVNTASIARVTYNPLLANDFLFLDHFCLTGRTRFEGSCI